MKYAVFNTVLYCFVSLSKRAARRFEKMYCSERNMNITYSVSCILDIEPERLYGWCFYQFKTLMQGISMVAVFINL